MRTLVDMVGRRGDHPPGVVPILTYHLVALRPVSGFEKYTVTPQAFAAQMGWLARQGYTSISLDQLLAHCAGRAGLPKRPIILTFDDGFQDCVECAVPILQAHGFTAIFYLVAGLAGQTSHWLTEERGIVLPLLDWTAARGLLAAGFTCGSHTMTHPHLAWLSPAACRDELVRSRKVLQDELGHEIRHLAYPFGSFNERVREMAAEAGYHSACSVRIGFAAPGHHPLSLHRVPVTGQDTLLDFVCRLHTGRTPEQLLRGKVDGLRWPWRRMRGPVG
jgi:peptidoglycan/xylan/chitin deacetylase (PgdA/CDA1 family)